jgi:hypothetical protein
MTNAHTFPTEPIALCAFCQEAPAADGVNGLCLPCAVDLAHDLAQEDERPEYCGSRCSSACGHCGACS